MGRFTEFIPCLRENFMSYDEILALMKLFSRKTKFELSVGYFIYFTFTYVIFNLLFGVFNGYFLVQ